MPTVVKQPSEIRDLAFNMVNLISAGAELVTAVGFASRKTTVTTTLAANALAEATTLELSANPGIGAFLTLNPAGLSEEQVKVSAVAGVSAPFTVTITPNIEFAHSNGESLNYEPGVSSRLFVSSTATVVDNVAKLRLRRGAAGHTYRVSCLGVCDNGEEIEDEVDVEVTDL